MNSPVPFRRWEIGLPLAAVASLAWQQRHALFMEGQQAGFEATRRRLEGLGRAGAGLAYQLRIPPATIKEHLQLLQAARPGGGNGIEGAVSG